MSQIKTKPIKAIGGYNKKSPTDNLALANAVHSGLFTDAADYPTPPIDEATFKGGTADRDVGAYSEFWWTTGRHGLKLRLPFDRKVKEVITSLPVALAALRQDSNGESIFWGFGVVRNGHHKT